MTEGTTGTSPLELVKNTYSTILLIFSTVIVMGLIFTGNTNFAKEVHPAFAFCMIWICVIWLSMVEGGQASFVGLTPVNKELYKDSHPLSYKCTSITNHGENLNRYLLGRQFMVIFIVFIINKAGAPVAGVELWNFPKVITDIFLVTGFAMILYTCMIGQLNSQVNASHCMLDYINNYFAIFTLYVAMALEWIGIVHASYLIQFMVAAAAGQTIESKEEPRDAMQNLFFWFRVLLSCTILVFCFTLTLAALFEGKTTMWKGVPSAVAIILFFLLMSVVGMLEGMQIAFFAVAKLPKSARGDSTFAKKTCDLLFKGDGHNLPGFMIGRQLCVVSCFFVIARVTTVSVPEGEENVMGFSDGWQEFFDTGLMGAIITTIVGSISWQLVASAFPMAFLSNPVTYILLRWCLFLEFTGIASGSWVLAAIHKQIAGFQRDEVYIGTAEERAAKHMEDHEEELEIGVGHLLKLPAFADHAPEALKKLMKDDPSVAEFIKASLRNMEPEPENTVPADVEN